MSTRSTQNYALREEHKIWTKDLDPKVLPQGAFVQPMNLSYVPKHITEKASWFNEDTEVYCYTRFGIIALPKSLIMKV